MYRVPACLFPVGRFLSGIAIRLAHRAVFAHRLRKFFIGFGAGIGGVDDVQMRDLIARDP